VGDAVTVAVLAAVSTEQPAPILAAAGEVTQRRAQSLRSVELSVERAR
jgi:hypothetical protein